MARKKKSESNDISANSIRDAKVFAMAAAGKTQSEIGDAVGLTRQSVGVILTSKEARRLVAEATAGIQNLLGEAVATIQDALRQRDKDMKTAANAALTILKGTGAISEHLELVTPKPFIIKHRDGSQTILGHTPGVEDESE